jgi:hypothetical protein
MLPVLPVVGFGGSFVFRRPVWKDNDNEKLQEDTYKPAFFGERRLPLMRSKPR